MTTIDAQNLDFRQLNAQLRDTADDTVTLENCLGQRYIASGMSGKTITIHGTPGNALGAYMDGCHVTVCGNAQDATGDTMNDGVIAIHGSSGDATGYAMRGGTILVEGDTGYRAGIHMKAYREKVPALVVGGTAGSFLGEYQAGGQIVVLGLGSEDSGRPPVGNFCGTGMHGGCLYVRGRMLPPDLPQQVEVREASAAELESIRPLLERFCAAFERNIQELLDEKFHILTPNTENPYKQLYIAN